MDVSLRTKKLKEIKEGKTFMTGIRMRYQGEMKVYNAYKIPLEYLIYNKYNGRIGSLVKSYEKQYCELNPEKTEDKKIIEQFLWDSKRDRNKNTVDDLIENQQKRYGIVTNDGVIIDGNRRASLLNRIYNGRNKEYKNYSENLDHSQYFIAVILPSGADKKEILRLETSYQMGEDEKLDYNPIEKYLKCKDLRDIGFEIADIAKMMRKKPGDIESMLDTLKVMEEYLDHYEYSGIYTRLERREDQFINLSDFLKKYKDRTKKTGANWGYTDLDINDLKSISFDYIRARYEGKDFRVIAKTGRDQNASFFCNEKVWKQFSVRHFDYIDEVNESSVEDYKKANHHEDLSIQLRNRDEEWEKKVIGNLKGNFKICEDKLEDHKEINQPEKLLGRAKSTLENIDVDSEGFKGDNVNNLVNEINSMTYEFKKILKKRD